MTTQLKIPIGTHVCAENSGLFVSRGEGCHPTRAIASYELIYIRHGVLELFEEDRKFRISGGEYLLLWPGRRHGSLANYDANLSFYWVHFTFDDSNPDAELDLQQHGHLREPERLEVLFRRFLDDQESGRLLRREANLLVALMLCEAAHIGERPDQSSGGVLATKAMELIATNFSKDISTSQIAETIGCNADYLGRVFRAAYGCSITTSIHRARIKEARRLLLDSSMNIDETAARCGFSDASHFRRVFKRMTAASPRQYRQLYLRTHMNTS